jgi:lipoprotein-anchoring transpeptidase ErfK/SrfK
MRVAELIIASCILAVSGAGVASAQFVEPYKVLEEVRRDRLEWDKRLAREAAARRQKEKADQAAQANAQRKLDQERTTAATSAPTPNTPSTQLGASSAREVVPGTPTPPVSQANAASGTLNSEHPDARSARETVAGTAIPPDPAIDIANGMPRSNQAAAQPVREGVLGVLVPTVPASSAGTETPASNQPLVPSAHEAVAGTPMPPPTRLLITVDKAAQRMRVTVDGELRHSWAVSTGRAQFETPTGTFRALRLAKVHYSKEWDNAPMPHSIFFTDRGHAIHGSNATRRLGRRASHGCVRLAPSKAAALFALVQAEGSGATKVTITNGTSADKAMRPWAVEARGRKFARVRRASSGPWQIGLGDGRTE